MPPVRTDVLRMAKIQHLIEENGTFKVCSFQFILRTQISKISKMKKITSQNFLAATERPQDGKKNTH